ncbi:MAG: glycosyltransferase [Oscillospiraceae bacterium]|nr:glycosyltransferase [Oscillospiraceae bacterium]
MISVLLAAYCGEKYIAEQIASILPQLDVGDELLVSDDSPEGHHATRDAVQSFDDRRIRYMQGPKQGVIKNIEFLLGQARGDILVLCDQDDLWLPGKLERTRAALDITKPELLVHGAKLTDEALRETGEIQRATPGVLRNLAKNTYTGCCMAFTRALLPHLLPFPEGIPMHDQWISLRAERFGTVRVVDEAYLLHRRHDSTQTGRGSTLRQKIQWRWNMAKALL